MTRTAIYHATPGHIVEQPAMEKPRPPFGGIFSEYWDIHKMRMASYNKAVAACRTIPVHESARSLWKDGQKVEEGKDYEVRDAEGVPEHYLSSFPNQKFIAFPLPVKSEDIIERTFSFDETLGYLIDFGNMVLRNRDRLKWDMSNDAAEWLADQLKKIHHH